MTKFVLTNQHTYWWPVEVRLPDPDKPGAFFTQSFKMRFAALPADEARDTVETIAALPAEEQVARQGAFMARVCLDWDENVVDENGKPVPFSVEELERAMQFAWFRIAINRAYLRSLMGDEARLGN